MSDVRLFWLAGGGMLLGGAIAALVLDGSIVTTSPLLALALAGAIAGGGAVALQHLVS